MKSKILVMLILSSVCMAEENSTLPLPSSGNVALTLDEYNKLVALAAKPPKKTDIPPLPYSLKHADIKLRVENEGVLGTLQLEGEVFGKGVSKVPLTSGMTILDARQNGKGVPLQQANGTHTALLPGPGEFSVALDTGLPLRIDAGRASFRLPVPATGSAQLSLVIPGEHTLANITPGLITSRKSGSGVTTIEATLAPGQPANIWWATREVITPAALREVRFLSDQKTLVSISESQMRVAVLASVTVVQGDPSQFHLQLPKGYEVTGVTGPTLDSTETHSDVLTLQVNAPGQRNHQFLISMERPISDRKADVPFLSFTKAQRETGEVLVEGAGTMEITAKEGGGLKRMDVKEVNPYLRSLAHFPPQAAFRYHRQPNDGPSLALEWVRFPDGSVLAAVAESAEVTTLVTSEGKSLTEVKLTVKNQAQPFLKVALPTGVSILSADVAGERVKPVQGPDGTRVPLLRPGFRPNGAYTISFVFMHSGAPFAKKGGAELTLPDMDIPISLLNWEIFLPERYKVKDFAGDVIAANLVAPPLREDNAYRTGAPALYDRESDSRVEALPGQMAGYVVDGSGAVMPYARVTVTSTNSGTVRTATTDAQGRWVVAAVPSGNFKAKVEMPGFKTSIFDLNYDSSQPSMYNFPLSVTAAAETIEVTAQAAQMQTSLSSIGGPVHRSAIVSLPANGRADKALSASLANQSASANVMNLQKRVAGVLPVPIDVPHAGTSFSFVRPLVLDEETKVTFSYRSR
jgi:Carboxypeptidase regulatory-like domain